MLEPPDLQTPVDKVGLGHCLKLRAAQMCEARLATSEQCWAQGKAGERHVSTGSYPNSYLSEPDAEFPGGAGLVGF